MIALEVRRCSQANDAQGGGDGALRGGEERAHEQYLHMHPDAFGEEWCEGVERSQPMPKGATVSSTTSRFDQKEGEGHTEIFLASHKIIFTTLRSYVRQGSGYGSTRATVATRSKSRS